MEFIDNQNIYPDANVMLVVYVTLKSWIYEIPFLSNLSTETSEICLILEYDRYD